MDSDIVIETRNLTKVYRDFWGREKVRALKALDLQIRRGEIFGLLGPNGSGKTTTLKLILGLIFPTSGEVLVFGQDAREVSKNERIGYLPEESYLYRFLTAEETLDFYGRLFNMPAMLRRQRAAELIEMVELGWAKRRQLREYSKGMTRRIGLAQALINDPELLLLDEPTTGLDPMGTRWMKDFLLKLRDQGKTIVMCSHQLEDVEDVCDRIGILHQGELKELGRVSELLKIRDRTEIQCSGLSPEAEREVCATIERLGGKVHFCGNPTTTLEELFVRIIRESEAHPGRRVRGVVESQPSGPAQGGSELASRQPVPSAPKVFSSVSGSAGEVSVAGAAGNLVGDPPQPGVSGPSAGQGDLDR
ncbi:MAG: ABC transporter ATP-binding protein [Thermoguttaceae bacterium]|nr:ABC transporter ATP-binding protein [Thermoguttaceae bacterium]MDW8036520.1 ABC transporter ATP-binding protein [Thermoguttaceae bacterium]